MIDPTTPVGLILAAGYGTRLRPITEFWPKPLIPFIGASPLALAYQQLIQLQLREIWINTHYRFGDFEAPISCFPRTPHSQNQPFISYEPKILGTGGVFNPLRTSLKNREVLVINGDVIAPFNLKALLNQHRATGSVATMILLPQVIPGETAVWYQDGRIVAIQKEDVPGAHPGNFACAQILSPDFLSLLPQEGSFDIINHGYRQALSIKMPLSYVLHQGPWFDIGSAQNYFSAVQSFFFDVRSDSSLATLSLNDLNICRSWYGKRPLGLEPFANDSDKYPDDLRLFPGSMIEKGSILGQRVSITKSVLLPGAQISDGAKIDFKICGPFGALSVRA
jgi:NDP-sugar pyrophosphorylase family protein